MTQRLTTTEYRALVGNERHGRAQRPARDYLGEFLRDLALLGYAEPTREFLFHPDRKWRLDAAWQSVRVGIEYQGIYGQHGAGHQSIKGLQRDYRKWTEAALLGWRVLLIDAASVADGTALGWVERALAEGL
jgi:hypothetical protein